MDNNFQDRLFIFVIVMDHQTIKKEYCQSCGMPLRFDVEEYLGTNADASRSDEYCYYCLKDGLFTVDIPMEEMVNIWVKYTGKYNEYSNTNYSPQELRTILNKRLPTLKRWKQKQVTKNIHHEAIDKLKSYIDRNLEKEIHIEELSNMANLSLFHLRRIFKNITGENIGSYIQRLRLEKVAHMIVSTDIPIHEITKQSNYQTKSSLSKAFQKHFGVAMSVYREEYTKSIHNNDLKTGLLAPQAEIRRLSSQKAICYQVRNIPQDKYGYMAVWGKLIHYRDKHMLKENSGQFISISLDNPQVTLPRQHRFYIGILTTGDPIPEKQFIIQEIPAGLYAIFKHKGNYATLPDLYQAIAEKWIPQSGYVQQEAMSFEIYLNTPRDTEISELLTEVYIPIKKPF